MKLQGNVFPGQKLRGRVHICDILTISAYGIAVKNGFAGTEKEWLSSLEANPERIKQYVFDYLRENPTQVDANLTTAGMAADAKAVGDAIKAIDDGTNEAISNHVNNKENPHNVTKSQVGLGNVDNTSDANKPISILQAEAIAEAKRAGTDAMAEANKKTEKLERTATLTIAGWANKKQTVTVSGVTADNTVIACTNPANVIEYIESVVRCTGQGNNSLTFTCDEVPSVALSVNVLIFN